MQNNIDRKTTPPLSDEIRRGRLAALGFLIIDICIFGDGLAQLLGIEGFWNAIFWVRAAVGVILTVYLYIIKKAFRFEDAVRQKDAVTRILWTASLIILALGVAL